MNPVLLANWDSLSLKRLSLNYPHNCFSMTSQLDYSGSGLLSESIAAKDSSRAYFHAVRPSLPYYVSDCRHKYSYASNNCLALDRTQDRNLLLFSHENKIIGLSLDDNRLVRSSAQESPLTKSHRYSSERAVSYGPFRYCTDNVSQLFAEDTEGTNQQHLPPILGLRVNQLSDRTQIQSISRNKIRFFEFSDEEPDTDLSLDLVSELNIESLRRSNDSLFDFCDRNQSIDNQLIVSFTKDNVIDLYDMEELNTIRSFGSKSFYQKPNHQIGLKWSEGHPQYFLYGEHKKLVHCDARAMKPAMNLLEFGKCDNIFEWELIYKFVPSKLNPNQVFVATDYHVLVTDYRYPKRSLIQSKHMLPNDIMRSMESAVLMYDYCEHEMVVSTNFYRNCLMSFTSKPTVVQLSSTHSPLHLANIKDIDFYRLKDCFYRGLQLLTSSDGFSVAFLSNMGDVFLQDFYWNDPEKMSEEPEEITWSRGVGSSDLVIDYQTVEYMTIIEKFLEEVVSKEVVSKEVVSEDDSLGIADNECLNCLSVPCEKYKGQCVCNDPNHLTGYFPQESGSHHSEEEKEFVCEKYFSEELLDVFDKIENNELCNNLWEVSSDYSQELFSLWTDEQITDDSIDK